MSDAIPEVFERGEVSVPTPAPQSEVVEYYREHAKEAATVGGYVRVERGKDCSARLSCFGPVGDRDGGLQWRVVEIDWENNSFLLAPIDDYGDEVGDE